MPKGNQKANQKAELKKIEKQMKKGFTDYEQILVDLKDQAEEGSMPLLAQSFDLSKAILTTYKKAWLYKLKVETA